MVPNISKRSDPYLNATLFPPSPSSSSSSVRRFLEGGGLALDEARNGEVVNQAHPLPPSATRRGQLAGEGAATPSSLPPGGNGASRGRNGSAGGGGAAGAGAGALGFGLGTGPAARLGAAYGNGGWAEGTARRREARREEAASEEWIASTRKQVAKLCEVASKPFWQVRRRCAA